MPDEALVIRHWPDSNETDGHDGVPFSDCDRELKTSSADNRYIIVMIFIFSASIKVKNMGGFPITSVVYDV